MATRRPFNRDEKVEVRMQDGEFAGAVYGGVIKSVWNHRYEVKMTTLTDGATGGPLNVHVELSYLQPVPPKCLDEVEVKLTQGDFVGGFYEGVITKTWKRRCEVRLHCLPDNTTGEMMVVKNSALIAENQKVCNHFEPEIGSLEASPHLPPTTAVELRHRRRQSSRQTAAA
ncbi:hypothetical protein L1887_32305 [Cichorium endivia]|nr:hypothetical protein L1887_32305 [Cichorium endivia]